MQKIPVRKIATAKDEIPSTERFSIRRVQDIVRENDLVHELHRHDFFFILVIKHGKGMHTIDLIEHVVSDHSVFFLRPGQVHQLELKAGSEGFLIEFNNEFYHPSDRAAAQRLKRVSYKDHCTLQTAGFHKLYSILEDIYEESAAKEEGYRQVIRSNLDIFFIAYLRNSTQPVNALKKTDHYAQERLEEFFELLESDLYSHKTVEHYTERMNLSAYQLNQITKSTIDKNASELINDRIILEAKRSLLATSSQVKEIADQLGYEDVSYFIRFFKKHTGFSPEAFRQNFG